MAMRPPRVKDNVNRFRKYAAVVITKELEKVAADHDIKIKSLVRDKLQKTYVDNVRASYTPRSTAGQNIKAYNDDPYTTHRKKVTYRHTGIFAGSIYTQIDDNVIKVMIRDELYPDGASTLQVYKWLTKGTKGGDKPYPYIRRIGNDPSDPDSYRTGWSRNFPTPAHLFELHTRIQMMAFLNSLVGEIENNKYLDSKYRKGR